jgi:hypothetical protein
MACSGHYRSCRIAPARPSRESSTCGRFSLHSHSSREARRSKKSLARRSRTSRGTWRHNAVAHPTGCEEDEVLQHLKIFVAIAALSLAVVACGQHSDLIPRGGVPAPPQLSFPAWTGGPLPVGHAGDEHNFRVSWINSFPPYTVNWDFGGGCEPYSATAVTNHRTIVQSAYLSKSEGGTFTVTVTVTNSAGASSTGSLDYSYGPAE